MTMVDYDQNNSTVASMTWIPAYDGNGNVVAYLDQASGNIVQEEEYGPFGEALRSRSTALMRSPIGWSSKYTDEETGLVYYGYRYYAPQVGRWISRDPFQEAGGVNLFNFVSNDSIDQYDPLGNEPEGEIEAKVGPQSGPDATPYGSHADIKFWASHSKPCQKIKFIQIVTDSKDGPQWEIDYNAKHFYKVSEPFPFYPGQSSNDRGYANMTDDPGHATSMPLFFGTFFQEFEACAVCLDDACGAKTYRIMGCVKWGHQFHKGKLIRRYGERARGAGEEPSLYAKNLIEAALKEKKK